MYSWTSNKLLIGMNYQIELINGQFSSMFTSSQSITQAHIDKRKPGIQIMSKKVWVNLPNCEQNPWHA